MAFGPLIFGLVSTFCSAAFLICRYGNPAKHHVAVTGSVFLAWYFSMLIIILMPLDVSTTAYKQCLLDHNISTALKPQNSGFLLNQTIGHRSNVSKFDRIGGDHEKLTKPQPLRATIRDKSDGAANTTALTPSAPNLTTIKPPESTTTAPTSTTLSSPVTITAVPSSSTTSAPQPPKEPCSVPWGHVPGNAFPVLWRIVYWSSQLLTWIILPMMQSYSTAGDFTTTGKLKTALYENAIYYGTFLCILVVLLVYLIIHGIGLDAGKLKVVCITASNTWGLFLLVLLLGSGLVELPRTLWNKSRKGYTLRYLYFKASKLAMEKCETEEKLDDAIEELRQVNNCITAGSFLRYYVDVIISKIPREKWEDNRRNRTTASGASVSEKSLVRLHKQVIKAMQGVTRTQVQWDTLLQKILYWEDISKSESNAERRFKSSLDYRPRGQLTQMICTPAVEWHWRCLIQPMCLKLLGGVFTFFTIILMFSEVTFFIRHPIISIVGIIHRSFESSYDYIGLEFFSMLTLGYLCLCTYFTVFKIRIFNLYYLVPNQQTSEYSLIFSGMMLCRLTPPLCLNFLGMIHLDQHLSLEHDRVETAYTKIMGHMDVISFISEGFNVYFPMLICVLGVATYLKWGSKILHALGFEQFLTDDDLTTDLVDEGRDLVKREKNRRQRQEDNEIRRRQRLESAPSQEFPTSRNRHLLGSSSSTENARAELLSSVGETPDYNSRDQSSNERWSGRPPSNLFDDV